MSCRARSATRVDGFRLRTAVAAENRTAGVRRPLGPPHPDVLHDWSGHLHHGLLGRDQPSCPPPRCRSSSSSSSPQTCDIGQLLATDLLLHGFFECAVPGARIVSGAAGAEAAPPADAGRCVSRPAVSSLGGHHHRLTGRRQQSTAAGRAALAEAFLRPGHAGHPERRRGAVVSVSLGVWELPGRLRRGGDSTCSAAEAAAASAAARPADRAALPSDRAGKPPGGRRDWAPGGSGDRAGRRRAPLAAAPMAAGGRARPVGADHSRLVAARSAVLLCEAQPHTTQIVRTLRTLRGRCAQHVARSDAALVSSSSAESCTC